MIPLAINGIGPVGAFGAGMEKWHSALNGNIDVTPETTIIKTRDGVYNLPIFRASSKSLANFVKSRKLRRLDNFSRLALLGAALAAEDAEPTIMGPRTGLIVASAHGATATTFAFLDSVINDGDALASPTLFSNSVHNAAASHIAEHFQITGPNLSLTQGADSLAMALLTAAQWLESNRIDTILCGIVDCYCDVLGYCWQSYQQQCNPENPPRTYGPGEGSLFFQLSRAEANAAKPKYGYLNKIALNIAAPPTTESLIYSRTGSDTKPRSTDSKSVPEAYKNRLQIETTTICGDLPIPASFDLAAAAIILYDRGTYNQKKTLTTPPFTGSTICCWQPQNHRKPLTGNCYWITNQYD
ncbi:beta-ketoacyl synthase chain length factor [bacterium]|nr:beta-ketoacyl synthase chain length factor [bacterium]